MFLRSLIAFLLMAVTTIVSAATEELTAGKRADIERLLEMTGALNLGKQMGATLVAQMGQLLKKARPDIPKALIDGLPEDVNAVVDENRNSLKKITVDIYHKYYTAAEIKELIRFYSSDLGKKTIQVMPTLLAESMAAGMEWGRALGPKIDARVKARGKKLGVDI